MKIHPPIPFRAVATLPPPFCCRHWISLGPDGWAVWFTRFPGDHPACGRWPIFATRAEAEAFAAGVVFAMGALTPRVDA